MPMNNHPLIESVTNSPLLIDPAQVDLVSSSLAHLIASETFEKMSAEMISRDTFWADGDDSPWRPYIVHDGVLQIPIQGVLLNRMSFTFGRWATGYQYIEKALLRGLDDANVRAIAFVVHSPGGEVAGCFELGEKIFAGRKRKPIRAFAADHAYSAAYALASAASAISITRSGGSGSVGVVTAHFDFSDALKQAGVKVTFVFAGDHKVDGNPYETLPGSVKDRMQQRIDKLYGVFVSTVAQNRGMEEVKVRETKALTYDAEDSIKVGFADRIGSLDEEMVVFALEATQAEDEQMTATAEELAAATAAGKADGLKEGKAEGLKEGATAERARISAILDSDEAKERPSAARMLAFDTDKEPAAVAASLAKLPKEQAEAPAPQGQTQTPFAAAMDATGNPQVGADAPKGDANASFSDTFFGAFQAPSAPARN